MGNGVTRPGAIRLIGDLVFGFETVDFVPNGFRDRLFVDPAEEIREDLFFSFIDDPVFQGNPFQFFQFLFVDGVVVGENNQERIGDQPLGTGVFGDIGIHRGVLGSD